ncbi:MAG: serpin family protein [Bacteroidales bacterium]|nr:serpin family protein [Bacteroidales bacterium]
MKRFGMIAAFAALMMVGLSCDKIEGGGDNDGENPYKALSLSTKSAEYARLGNSFAFEYIDRINAFETKDYIISPLSMQFLLGMILDGTKGQTADEICNVLGYGAGEVDAVNEYCLSMLEQLPELDKQTKLSIANAIFVNQKIPLLDSYKKAVGKNFNAEVSNLDFTNANGSLKTINNWCNKQTNGMIPKVLDKVTPDAIAYLLNALYFKSQWSEKFSKSNTSNENFSTGAGQQKKVPMMKAQNNYPYGECEAFRALKIPYGNGAFNMLVLLPAEGKTISDVTAALKTMDWSGFVNGMYASREVDLWLPKYEIEKYEIELNDILAAMGMPSVFRPDVADFSAMCEYPAYISLIKQDAAIKVDESGTEAAAVSIAEIRYGSTGINLGPIVFHADRPFLYLITETSTNSILFAGRYSAQ